MGFFLVFANYFNPTAQLKQVLESCGRILMKLIQTFAACALSIGLAACGGGGGTSTPATAIIGLTLDSATTPTKIYVANADNQTLQTLDLNTNAVTTLAGLAGTSGSTNGSGNNARFYEPFAVAFLGGNLYVSDTYNYVIKKVTPAGVTSTLAGTVGTSGSTDGTGTAATFNVAKGITGVGNFLYVVDTFSHTVRKIDITSGAVTTLAGYAGTVGSADNATGSSARFNYPFGIAVDSSNNLYVTDTGNQTIRVISSSGAVSTLAGSIGSAGSTDGTGTVAKFSEPAGVATDGTYLFVADSGNHTIRKVVIATGAVSTLAGAAGLTGSADGTGVAARFNTPTGLTMDNAGNLYVTDQWYSKIRKITSTGVVTTLTATF
jgi:hypothetical protein